MTEKNDDDEGRLQTAVDALDSSSTSVDAAVSQHNLLDKEKMFRFCTPILNLAQQLNLPKSLMHYFSYLWLWFIFWFGSIRHQAVERTYGVLGLMQTIRQPRRV